MASTDRTGSSNISCIDDITLSLHKKQLLANELFQYLTFETNGVPSTISKECSSNDRTVISKDKITTSTTETTNNTKISSKTYLSKNENKQKVRNAIGQIIDHSMNNEFDDLVNTMLLQKQYNMNNTQLDDIISSLPSYLYVLETMKMASSMLDNHSITIQEQQQQQKEGEDNTTKKLKSFSLFDVLDNHNNNWNINDIITTDKLLESFHAHKTNKIEGYKEVLSLLQKVEDIEDISSNNWKELNDVILRPSLSLPLLQSTKITIHYYNMHYELFTKCQDNGLDFINVQYDIFMNVLYSILHRCHTTSFIIMDGIDENSFIYISTDSCSKASDDDDDENTIKIKIFYKSMNILHKMLISFYSKIQYLSEENIDKLYITLFSILRFRNIRTIIQPLHILAVKDLYADWFVLYTKQIPAYQLVQYLLLTDWIYDIIYCVTQVEQLEHSNIKCKECVDLNLHTSLSKSESGEKLTKKDVEYTSFIHSLSILKTVLITTQMKLLPWNTFQSNVQSSQVKQSQQRPLFTEEYIQNESKHKKDYRFIRIFLDNDDNKDEEEKISNNLDIIKQIILKPFLSTLTHELFHTISTSYYDERLIDMCCQPIQMLLSYYSNNTSIISNILCVLFKHIFLPIYSHDNIKHENKQLYYMIPIQQSCNNCIMNLVSGSSFMQNNNNIDNVTTCTLKNLFYEFIFNVSMSGLGFFYDQYHKENKEQQPKLLRSHLKLWLTLLSLLDSISNYIEDASSSSSSSSSSSPLLNASTTCQVNSENYKHYLHNIKTDFSTFCHVNHLKYEEQIIKDSSSSWLCKPAFD